MVARTFPRHRSGAALIVTITVLSILLLLLTGFLAESLLDRGSARSYLDGQQAKLISQGAVSHAVDLLRTNIPDPARLADGPATAVARQWAINPGRLSLIADNGTIAPIDLHTGEAIAPNPNEVGLDIDSVDLNRPVPGQPAENRAITGISADGSKPVMRVKWANLLRDSSQGASATNPIVGRYAFWIDDESGRINFNTALGKPALSAAGSYGTQVSAHYLTPQFSVGSGASAANWALGKPQSVNLDHLFDNTSQLQADKLLADTFLHGYARRPEAIMDYVSVPGGARAWYDRHRYNLTFYNRSPEFNVFGLSRLFTTFIPLSLEAGPTYQHPFVYDPTGQYKGNSTQILHLNSLLGSFGFTSQTTDDDGNDVLGGNVVNREQVDMLMDYMKRKWPGYQGTFYDKYGEDGCRQIALNVLLMSRVATAPINSNVSPASAGAASFSSDYGLRTTSVDYSPSADELPGSRPKRFYWRFQNTATGKTKLMLPQMPGPYITEVRLIVKPVAGDPPPNNSPAKAPAIRQPRYLQYYYEAEYYMPPMGPVVDIEEFPVRMDYLKLTAISGGSTVIQQFGMSQPNAPGDPTDITKIPDRSWNLANNLGVLQIQPGANTLIGPTGASVAKNNVPNRITVRSAVFTLGQTTRVATAQSVRVAKVPSYDAAKGDYTNWDPYVFYATQSSNVSLDIQFRPGMSINADVRRPRQMIPLGETAADTLQAHFDVNLLNTDVEQCYSWQIEDPRLSGDLAQWVKGKSGPGPTAAIGTPNKPGPSEPAEDSDAKSKFLYLQRAPSGAKIAGFAYDRGDEYDTASRIASPGYWSLLHTGMQSGTPWRTLNLSETAADTHGTPPDGLLLDLFGGTYPMAQAQWQTDSALPDQFSTASFMNSTAGQVNLNTRVYPRSDYFQAPERHLPLEAVLQNLPLGSSPASVVDAISGYQSDNHVFAYVGDLANVPAANSGATQWDRETILRNMAGCLTTKSNTFGVWGVAQAVHKNQRNHNYGRFEVHDDVRAEKRFYALVERYVWQGRDGVPGNGHLDGKGTWDRLATQTASISLGQGMTNTLFQLPGSPPLVRGTGKQLNLDVTGSYPVFDGPEPVGMDPYTKAALGNVRWQKSSLEDAHNPPQAVIKYRVVYFKYLDE